MVPSIRSDCSQYNYPRSGHHSSFMIPRRLRLAPALAGRRVVKSAEKKCRTKGPGVACKFLLLRHAGEWGLVVLNTIRGEEVC